MRIYVASSWKNDLYPKVIEVLRDLSHEVYDFRNSESKFSWQDIDLNYENWNNEQFVKSLEHPLAKNGFGSDMAALAACDICLLVLPCGRSVHLELGYATGFCKKTAILLDDNVQPELMYKMVDKLFTNLDEVKTWFKYVF